MFGFEFQLLPRSTLFRVLKLMMLPFTPTEQAELSRLPQEVQRTLEDYRSVAENYLLGRSLPVLTEGHKFGLLEIYYDCAVTPVLAIKDGVLTTNQPESEQIPTIIEGMSDDGIVFIQVNERVILNRIQCDLPEIKFLPVEVY